MSDPVADLKHELLAAAERRESLPAPSVHRRPRAHIFLVAATVAVAVAASLLLTAPWKSSPGFLERAQAALSRPEGGVLHTKWETTSVSTTQGCVTRAVDEMWVDQTSPYRYRAVMEDYPPSLDCTPVERTELGGTLDPLATVIFEPPATLRAASLLFNPPRDPVEMLRDAIARGIAHDGGETQLNGRTVRLIRLGTCSSPDQCEHGVPNLYVDPTTFYPVETRTPGYFGTEKIADLTFRYQVFEYLPRTDANLALTDIRAGHPDATGP